MAKRKILPQVAQLTPDEGERLSELQRYDILDTPAEDAFERLTHMAAKRFGVPMALVSLVDANRQWFKSHYGIDAAETPRDIAFCAHAILDDGVLVVHDATKDERFAHNPLVTSAPDIRFYAGAPLITKTGHKLGTVCVIDRVPHPEFNADDAKMLADFAAIAVDAMELRLSFARARHDLAELKAAQEGLMAEQRRANEAIQEKVQFIASISHELRTPMNGILGMLYLMRDTPLNAVQKEYMETIDHSAQNLLLLINDVLDLTKIEAHELILEQVPFDVKTSFSRTLKLLEPLAQRKNIGLCFEMGDEVPGTIVSDPGRFSQILNNLVGNAIKFTNTGNVKATLSYDAKQQHLHCTVDDTGIGVPHEQHGAIFEKFVQGTNAMTQTYGGTGLGLAITKQLVGMMGGEIGFSSTVGVGSHFWFYLPVHLADNHAPVQTAGHAAAAFTRIPAAQARILMADDHPVNRMYLSGLLKKMGFTTIDMAEDGSEALQAIDRLAGQPANNHYQLILMDCRMPVCDGYEATRRIRAGELASGNATPIPIIAMTANALAGDRELCFAAGMDEYISKPIQPELLTELLQRRFVLANEAASNVGTAVETRAAPPMDMARLELVADTDEEKSAMLAMFFKSTAVSIATLHSSRREGEFAAWKNAAHAIRGASGNIGMPRLAALCQQAENAATATYQQRSEMLAAITAEIDCIRAHVAPFLTPSTKDPHAV